MNKIAQIRNELGITQSQLAERIGWKQPRIANYEAGIRMPSLIVAQEIVKALNSFGAKKSIDDVFPVQN
ncbi:helix-turn-helix transcriptional regulator [Pasteurella multocida subsp. multocida]|uniref:helix-turn-helix transcriptional regulator n=1 Tax=Pasteurella multocida TaxID=747 RepID=UPI0008FA3849|nr:helix-turn-helix transcriptional regulator [Pasteurella multocida]MBF6981604.1 helix-turn-helix transcriptional regulator [Pasteurella multocida]MBF6986087.1 helix-turn-helix transcriptional regulator [Pasteurella multocida]MDA5609306.1 helix-turn-helix transcriptional regulator [Pasteurella multocida subsp. multocida]MDA5611800.1 helix-turn-helix transcriptional regulator [Pasteurella multocida]MDA5614266.1 helix-turn-helix transcriptional regulator [Pasteurella multocida]